MDLLTALLTKQTEIGATDKAFAHRLGMPRETWSAIRAGRVALDGRVLLKAARATRREFPDLAAIAASSLLGESVGATGQDKRSGSDRRSGHDRRSGTDRRRDAVA